jgi:ribosome-associated heat shock protein Hsp15
MAENEKSNKHRIDKWLWCVRVFKSRTLASEACSGGKVKIEGDSVKPSRAVNPGDIITVRSGFIKMAYRVLGFPDKRVSAKLAVNYVLDITPEEEKLKQEIARRSYIGKYKGSGRPTKKDRREINKLKGW